MKNVLMLLTIFALAGFALSGCGANSPFKRGKGSDDLEGGNGKTNTNYDGKKVFETEILPALRQDCIKCHLPAESYEEALDLIEPGEPEKSLFYTKAKGVAHQTMWKEGSAKLKALGVWITKLGETPSQNTDPNNGGGVDLPPAPENYDSKVQFDEVIHPLLMAEGVGDTCLKCHSAELKIPEKALEWVLKWTKKGDPLNSRIYMNAGDIEEHHTQVNWMRDRPQDLETLGIWIYRLQFYPIGNGDEFDGETVFEETILPLQDRDCAGCHDGGPARTYEEALERVTPGNPAESVYSTKARGKSHMGGEIWPEGSDELKALNDWITKLAK